MSLSRRSGQETHVEERRELGEGVTLERGPGVLRFSNYDSPIEHRDLAVYVQLEGSGYAAWRRVRDASPEDVLTAASRAPHLAPALIELAPQWRDAICRTA